ncbi:hypothetical protein Tco_0844570 [Tanacetum coccineum]
MGRCTKETRNSSIPTPIRSPRIHTNLLSSDTEKLQDLTDTPHTTSSSSSPHKKLAKTNRLLSLFKTKPTRFKCYKSLFHELQGCYGYLFCTSTGEQVVKHVPEQVQNQAILQERGNIQAQISTQIENAIANVIPSQVDASLRDEEDIGSIKLMCLEVIPYGIVFQEEQAPSTSGNQEQDDDFDFWTDFYASDDDEIPTKQVSQDIIEEVSLTIDEKLKLKNVGDGGCCRRICTSGDEHQWVNKFVKKFNPYARYGVEHWKNPHAKIFYIRKQKELGKPKEEVPDYADTRLLWSLSVFIRSTVIWERVHDFQLGIESYQQKVNLTAPTMTFPGIKDHEMFSIIYEPVHGIIYKNSKKEYGEVM